MKTMIRTFVLTAAIAGLNTAHAIVLPVDQDSASNAAGLLRVGKANGGKVGSLPVNTNAQAFVRFGVGDLKAILSPSEVSAARLKIYFPSAAIPADVTVNLVTADWSEAAIGPEPAFNAAPIATIPAASVVAKTFVLVDVTATVKDWLDTVTDYGFAVVTATGKLTIGAKEGSGSGYPAELEIDLVPGAGAVSEAQLDTAFTAMLPRLANANTYTGLNTFTGEVQLQELSANGGSTGRFELADLPSNQVYTFGTGGTVWTSGNDGVGSGLSADFLDGLSASDFAQRDVSNNFTGTTNTFSFGSGTSLQIRQDGGLVPGLNITGGGNPGILRLRDELQIWPSDDASRAGALDLRNTAGSPTIVLNSAGPSVGIGTPSPLVRLHVANGGITPGGGTTIEDEVTIQAQDAVLSLYSQNQGTYASALALKELNADGTISNTWGLVRRSTMGGNAFELTFGTNANYSSNTTVVRVDTNGDVTAAGTVSADDDVSATGNVIAGGFNVVSSTGAVVGEGFGFTVTPVSGYVLVQSGVGIPTPLPVTLSATNAIADGTTTGQTLILQGTSDAGQITVPDNANVRLAAATRVLGLQDTLQLIWDGSDWVEVSYANNN